MNESTLSLSDLTELSTPALYALGLTDRHIAALDAADCANRAAATSDLFERRQLEGAAQRAMARAAGTTVAEAAAILGYWPEGVPR
jgi:hypothetical protein